MADIGLFGLMQQVMDIYAIIPRGTKRVATNPIMPPKTGTPRPTTSKSLKKKKEPVVEERNKKQTSARAIFDNGFRDPLVQVDPDTVLEGEGEEVNDDSMLEIIYFDVKTGTIGRVSRSKCREKGIIVTQDDEGQEQLDGGVDNEEEKEQLIWLLKKGMKQKNGQTTSAAKNMPPKSPPSKKARPPKVVVASAITSTSTSTRTISPGSSKSSPPRTAGVKKSRLSPKELSSRPLPKRSVPTKSDPKRKWNDVKPMKLSELKIESKSNHVSTNGFCENLEFVHAVRDTFALLWFLYTDPLAMLVSSSMWSCERIHL